MKKRFTPKENFKHCINENFLKTDPGKRTVVVLQQFARVYTVEKCNDGTLIGLVLN